MRIYIALLSLEWLKQRISRIAICFNCIIEFHALVNYRLECCIRKTSMKPSLLVTDHSLSRISAIDLGVEFVGFIFAIEMTVSFAGKIEFNHASNPS